MESDSWRVDKHNWCKMISLRRISDGCYLLFLFLMLLQDFIPIFDGLLKSFSNLGLFVCLCIFLNRNHWRINQNITFYGFCTYCFTFICQLYGLLDLYCLIGL